MAKPASKRRSVGGVFVVVGLFGTASHVKTGWPRRQQGIGVRHGVLYLAGPAANIGAAAMFYALGTSAEPGFRGIALTVSAVGVLAGVATLIPKRYATGLSDGANLLRLLFGDQRHSTGLGPDTVRVLAELRERSTSSGNRWRTYEDLGTAMRLRVKLADSVRPSGEPPAIVADTLGR